MNKLLTLLKPNALYLKGYAVPILFSLTLFVQVVLFQWFCYHNILITSLWKAPAHFAVFWLSKIGIALFFASFCLLTKRKWWTVAIVALVSLWCISNLIYYRANNLVLSVSAMLMADNLNGFQSSIRAYWNWQSTLLSVIPLVYALGLYFLKAPSRRTPMVFACLLGVVLVGDVAMRYIYRKIGEQSTFASIVILPYQEFTKDTDNVSVVLIEDTRETNRYISYHSIISNFPRIFAFHHASQYNQRKASELRMAGGLIPDEVEALLGERADSGMPSHNLIIVLVESLESWVLDVMDGNGVEIAPNLRMLSEKGLYLPYVRSQVREGVSGDGQLILNTGVLPLQQGAACMIFGDNRYRSLADPFAASATIIPTQPNTWNQSAASVAYGYQQTLDPGDEVQDEVVFRLAERWLDTVTLRPFCCQVITLSTHSPFDRVDGERAKFGSDMPQMLRNYLNCVRYADSCIGRFVERLEARGLLENTTVVITGDHTIFKDNMLREYRKAAMQYNLDFKSGHNFVPAIILSPAVEKNTTVADTCGQYDIYPTLRALLGAELYPWKGFGRNLLDPESQYPLSEQDAGKWSDVIIRSNWFATKM